jgi:hypothetical protein
MKALQERKYCWELCAQSYDDDKFTSLGNMEVFYRFVDNTNYLCWRGSDEGSDWRTNLYFFSKKVKGIGKFHRGFLKNIRKHGDEILKLIPPKRLKYPVVVLGHSKGGAEAQTFLVLYSEIVDRCVTFGAPKPIRKLFDRDFEEVIREKTTHYINPYDAVTKQPPFWKWIGKEVIKSIRKRGSEHPISVYGEFFKDV